MCLVHWNLFQHPTKLFEELPIPYIQIKRSAQTSDIEKLFKELKSRGILAYGTAKDGLGMLKQYILLRDCIDKK